MKYISILLMSTACWAASVAGAHAQTADTIEFRVPSPSMDDTLFWEMIEPMEGVEEPIWQTEGLPAPDHFILMDTEPVILNADSLTRCILASRNAFQTEIQGSVVLRLLVRADGSYVTYHELRSVHPILTDHVVEFLPLFRFKPAMRGGEAIGAWVTFVVAFE